MSFNFFEKLGNKPEQEHSNLSYIKTHTLHYQIFISVKPTICLFNLKPIFVQFFIKINI